MDIPVAVQNRKEKFKSTIFSSMTSFWCILSPMPYKAVIFDPLMQGHEMSYFLKLIVFLYSSYLYHVSLFFLVSQGPHSNPLGQRCLLGVCERQTRPACCRGMAGLEVTPTRLRGLIAHCATVICCASCTWAGRTVMFKGMIGF